LRSHNCAGPCKQNIVCFVGLILSWAFQIANNSPGTYSAALGFQIMGRRLARLPRWLWVCISVLIYTACALGGRNSLFDIFENFLALMGYWVTIFLGIVIEEDLIFRRNKGYNWANWAEPSKLPIGFAALITFLTGWAWAVVSMDQTCIPYLPLLHIPGGG
jgi:purine-cytosine permease-like protein